MCMQCMAVAMTSTAAATGTRAWLAARRPRWLTPLRMRRVSAGLIGVAVLVPALFLSGSAPPA